MFCAAQYIYLLVYVSFLVIKSVLSSFYVLVLPFGTILVECREINRKSRASLSITRKLPSERISFIFNKNVAIHF